MPKEKETITITRELYWDLLRAEAELAALECFGVNNWEGYEEAMGSIPDDDDES